MKTQSVVIVLRYYQRHCWALAKVCAPNDFQNLVGTSLSKDTILVKKFYEAPISSYYATLRSDTLLGTGKGLCSPNDF